MYGQNGNYFFNGVSIWQSSIIEKVRLYRIIKLINFYGEKYD